MSLENYIKKFQILSESKLGDVKPYLIEGEESNIDVESILEKLQLAFFGDTKSILTSVHDTVLGVDAYNYSLGGNIRAYNIGEGMLLDGGMADNLIISVPRVGFFNYETKGIVNGVWEVKNEYYDEEKVKGKFTFYVNENKIELTETERYHVNSERLGNEYKYNKPQTWTVSVTADEKSAFYVLEQYAITNFFTSESINDGDKEFTQGIKNAIDKYNISIPDELRSRLNNNSEDHEMGITF
jgi:hypothetical protein